MPNQTLASPTITPIAKHRASPQLGRWLSRLVAYGILGAWSLFMIYAIGWMILSSFKTNAEILKGSFFPSAFNTQTYDKVFNILHFGRYLLNSTLYVSVSLVLLLAICAPAAYVLSRHEFPGRKFLVMLFASGMGVPAPLLFIPLFILATRLGITNTISGIVVAYVSVSVPFTVYLLTGFFGSLPKELEEAAVIDGCSNFQVLWQIMLPLAQPGLITAAIFNGIGMWREFQWALIFVNTDELRTLSLGLNSVRVAMQYSADYAGLFAAVVVVMIPTLLLYLFLSEKMISGITMGSLK